MRRSGCASLESLVAIDAAEATEEVAKAQSGARELKALHLAKFYELLDMSLEAVAFCENLRGALALVADTLEKKLIESPYMKRRLQGPTIANG